MGVLLKLLVLVILLGVATKLGVFDQLGDLARDAAVQSGISAEEIEAASASWLSFSGAMAAIGSLPPPYGAIGKVLLIVALCVAATTLLFGLLAAAVRSLRWMRDFLT